MMLVLMANYSGFRHCFPKKDRDSWKAWGLLAFAAAGPGIIAGFLFSILLQIFSYWNDSNSGHWHAITFGTPLVLLILSAAVILHLGIMGIRFPDERREWWSRLGAWLTIYLIIWTGWFLISMYGPLFLWFVSERAAAGLGAGWVVSTVFGVIAGRSPRSSENGNRAFHIAAKVGPYVFIIGLLILIALGLHFSLAYVAGISAFEGAWAALFEGSRYPAVHWEMTDVGLGIIAGAILLLGLLCGVLAFRVDINEFSMHHFYRNRLVRCYLGASRKRDPQPFTGFDILDDIPLSKLRADKGHIGPIP
ncbi:MAG: hypothetical protein L0Z53_22010, partial [Acidobacteriales bacterium]|nr:hypothetical protein [Terriglobales bacterium]